MNNSTVLVVDDEAHVRAFADEVLTQAGFTVLLAEGGAEALAILNAVHIDVMVSDILMPSPQGPKRSSSRAAGRRSSTRKRSGVGQRQSCRNPSPCARSSRP